MGNGRILIPIVVKNTYKKTQTQNCVSTYNGSLDDSIESMANRYPEAHIYVTEDDGTLIEIKEPKIKPTFAVDPLPSLEECRLHDTKMSKYLDRDKSSLTLSQICEVDPWRVILETDNVFVEKTSYIFDAVIARNLAFRLSKENPKHNVKVELNARFRMFLKNGEIISDFPECPYLDDGSKSHKLFKERWSRF